MDALVHCRTGSLERKVYLKCFEFNVHCRTGSLEKEPETMI